MLHPTDANSEQNSDSLDTRWQWIESRCTLLVCYCHS